MRNFNLEKTVKLKLMMFDDETNRVDAKHYELKFTISSEAIEEEGIYEAQIEQNVTFSKIIYFLENVVNESFVFRKEIIPSMNKFVSTEFENNLMLLPALEENILVLALHSKMNAVATGSSCIEHVQLKDLDLQVSYDYYSDEFDDIAPALPDSVTWMGELSIWELPWWLRADASTYDNYAESKEELKSIREVTAEGNSENPHNAAFEILEEEIRSLFKKAKEMKEGKIPEEAEIIEIDFADSKKRKKWTPKII